MSRFYTADNFPDTDLTDVTCAICSDVFFIPHMVIECGHIFCKSCIRKWTRIKQSCPTCRIPILKIPIINRNCITEKINSLKYHCDNKDCKDVVNVDNEFRSIKDHKDKCKFDLLKCKFCDAGVMRKDADHHIIIINDDRYSCINQTKCPNEGCNDFILKKDLDDHLKKCEFYMTECPFCNESVYFKDIDRHIENFDTDDCLCINKIKCPNTECWEYVLNKDLDKHLKDCIYQQIDCPNTECCEYILNKDLDKHLKDCIYQKIDCPLCKSKVMLVSYIKHSRSECYRILNENLVKENKIIKKKYEILLSKAQIKLNTNKT